MDNHRLPPDASRRETLQRLFALAAVPASTAWLVACGGGGSDPAPAAPNTPPTTTPPPPAAQTPLQRVKASVLGATPPGTAARAVDVTQGSENTLTTGFGADVQVFPPLGNGQSLTLGNIPQVWARRGDLWKWWPNAFIQGQLIYPIVTTGAGLHFEFDGSAFEILFAGHAPSITLLADNAYCAPALIQTTLADGVAGPTLSNNRFVRFDFGSRASPSRRISVYPWSAQGPCAIAVAAGDTLTPWDRSQEASICVMADSYGGGNGPQWRSGPFWEAAALLGIPHVDADAIGGTGYARVATNTQTADPVNTFRGRLAAKTVAAPDLFLTAGGINDNNSQPATVIAPPPDNTVIYATGDEARAGFDAAVHGYYTDMRAALPETVMVATAPWTPRQSIPTDPIAQSKADVILAALQAAGGPWVFLDNLNGGWRTSSGGVSTSGGPWQTGTGTVAAQKGDGNGDLFITADGTHPNQAGCTYLATRIAEELRAALQTL